MESTPLLFVLGLLRRIKSQPEFAAGYSAQHHLEIWASEGGQEAQLRLAIAIQQNLEEARNQINRMRLKDEAKIGLAGTVETLIKAFSLNQLPTNLLSQIPSIDSAISNFAIITSMIDAEVPEEFYAERDSFVREIEAFLNEVDGYEIDERLKDTTKRQIALLVALLKNAEAVGVEAALSSYWELVIKVRNRASTPEENQREDTTKIWDRITSWSERIEALSKLYDVAHKLLPHLDKLQLISGS